MSTGILSLIRGIGILLVRPALSERHAQLMTESCGQRRGNGITDLTVLVT